MFYLYISLAAFSRKSRKSQDNDAIGRSILYIPMQSKTYFDKEISRYDTQLRASRYVRLVWTL